MFKFELKQGTAVSNITLDAPLLSDWKQYRHSLKNFQKGINELLTLIIERDKSLHAEPAEVESDISDSEDDQEKGTKRSLSFNSQNSSENKKTQKV